MQKTTAGTLYRRGGPRGHPTAAFTAGAHEGRPYTRGAQLRIAPDQSNKSPAWFPPGRKLAQSMSFNFPNNLICATGSSARTNSQDIGLNFCRPECCGGRSFVDLA